MKKVFRTVLSALLVLCSCQKQTVNPAQALRINLGHEPSTLDPRKSRDLDSITVCRMLFEGLVRTSREGKAELALADKVDVSEDGLRYTFRLRSSEWSNGKSVTSYDFAESWKTILDPQFPTDIAYQLYVIKNGRKAKLGEVSKEMIGLETPDPFTLIVELEQPTPYFLDICCMAPFLPVPEEIGTTNEEWSINPDQFIGNGPFTLKEWDRSDRIHLVKNERYWNSREVSLKEMDLLMVSPDTEIRMFEEGKLDWAGSPLSVLPPDAIAALKEEDKLKVSPLSGTCFFRVNTNSMNGEKENPLANVVLRKALASAMRREAISTHILQGGQLPARSLVPLEMGLTKEGYFDELSGEELRAKIVGIVQEPLVITVRNAQRDMSVAQAIQKQWEEILQIPVELQVLESKVFFQAVKDKQFQLALGSWIADFNDPINFLEVFKFKDGSTNNTGWESAKYVDLLNQSAVCRNQDERAQLMREAEAELMEGMPIIPIFHFAINYLEREGVSQIALSPIGQIDFRWAKMETAEPSRTMR